jgi:circadian clock protein KaiC
VEKIATGVLGLDRVLYGGLPKSALHILAGVPGTGKSTLAQQIAFSQASAARPVLYLTTLSEPLSKLIGFLQQLEFADVDRIGTEILFENIADLLIGDTMQLPGKLLELIKRHRPGLIVIDSFKAIGDIVPDSGRWRKIVFEVGEVVAAYDATTILVGEYDEQDMASALEFAVADGVLELRRAQRGTRDERFIRVAKLRGSEFLDGTHAFTIGRSGIRVYPRLVQSRGPLEYGAAPERLHSGIGGLDQMIAKGWLRGTSTVVMGPSGSGKTLLGLHFLRQGAADGEAPLMVTFQENPTQLRRCVESMGWDGAEMFGPGGIELLYRSPVELQIDRVVHAIFESIERIGAQRVVIDALGDLERGATDPDRFVEYLYALLQSFASQRVSSMLLLENHTFARPELDVRTPAKQAFYIADNLLALGMDLRGDLTRTVRILKTRGSVHDGRERPLRITTSGMEIDPG